MSLFLVTFFFLYGGMHYYAYRKIGSAVSLTFPAACLLVVFMLIMVLAPLLVRLLEREGFDAIAVPFAFAGYLWMGFLFLFIVFMLAVDLSRFLVRAGGLFFQQDFSGILSDQQAFFVAMIFSLGASLYGYREAQAIRLEKVVVPTTKLPPTIKSFRIVQISDVHLGLIVQEQRLQKIIREIEKAQPDVLVSSGDLLDGQTDGLTALAVALGKVQPRFGKIAVAGNHEFYSGIDGFLQFMKRAGFSVLRGEMQDVAGLVTVVGVDDPAGTRQGYGKIREEDLLRKTPNGRFVLLLKHRPVVAKESVGLFDLQLSGHVHKGQIFPFELMTYLFYPVKTGLSRIMESANLYVSRGAGTWGPPIRFLAPPEVTVIDLVNNSVTE
ncbi:MAG: metallophosphoesterase [Deltaproteobacteria bacterium]|nr:metallophosphoesterase [Deltaproteobacteria bacterium]